MAIKAARVAHLLLAIVVSVLVGTLSYDTCSETSECVPGAVCHESSCDCTVAIQSENSTTCSECNVTALLASPCCCDFIPYCILEQQTDQQLHIRFQVTTQADGYEQAKYDVFLLKNNKYVYISSVILATKNCNQDGIFQALQIIQPESVCSLNVSNSQWPPYIDWELNSDGQTVYPTGTFADESQSCYGNTEWNCISGVCAYTSDVDVNIIHFDSTEHYDWCAAQSWRGCVLTSSSNLTDSYRAEYAQIDRWEPGLEGGWAPDLLDTEPYIQITFSELRTVRGVVTQGMAANFNRRMDSFKISYFNGSEEIAVQEKGGGAKIYNSSARYNSKAVVTFEAPITTTVLKVIVVNPQSLYLIGGRLSAIEEMPPTTLPQLTTPTQSVLQQNEELWNTFATGSAEDVFLVADNLLVLKSDDRINDWNLSIENGHSPFDIPTRIDELVRVVGQNLSNGETIRMTYDNYEIIVTNLNSSEICSSNWTHSSKGNTYTIPGASLCEEDILPGGGSAIVLIALSIYSSLDEIINDIYDQSDVNNERRRVASDVVSVVVYTEDKIQSVPFTFNLEHTISDPEMYTSPSCQFWDLDKSIWSGTGCKKLQASSTSNTTSCHCNHTTSFAILMRLSPDENDKVADILSKIGLALSIAALMIGLFIFFVLRFSLIADRVIVHVNLMVAILLADVTFLIGVDKTSNELACKAVAALLHFLFEAVFCWMLVEGVHLYRQIIRVFESERPRTWLYFVVGWGAPAVIVAVAFGVKYDSYGTDTSCWLSVTDGSIWAFIGTAIPILLTNFVILLLVVKTVIAASQKQQEAGKINQIKAGVRSSFLLLPLLGITWLIGPFVMINTAIEYVFILLNALQGFFISVFYCFLNSEVRGSIQQKIRKTRDSQAATFSSSEEKKSKITSLGGARRVRVSPAPPDQEPPSYSPTGSKQCT